MTRVLVVGSSGFVGAHVLQSLEGLTVSASGIRAPRLGWHPEDDRALQNILNGSNFAEFVSALQGHRPAAVVNAAGAPDAMSDDASRLFGANAAAAAFVARAAREAGVRRLVYVSSAAVQGRRATLDSSDSVSPLTPYAESKAMGESLSLKYGPSGTVIYRPAGVHAASRRVTQSVARYARSRLAIVGDPDAPTPQALAQNVGDAISFLALADGSVPSRVHHPAEDITVGSMLQALGGRAPVSLPMLSLIRPLVRLPSGRHAGHARRLEMLWFGQTQAKSWLSMAGWNPPVGKEGWYRLGSALQNSDWLNGGSMRRRP
jgi:nucleoside-diphosphate-sugar epimerase